MYYRETIIWGKFFIVNPQISPCKNEFPGRGVFTKWGLIEGLRYSTPSFTLLKRYSLKIIICTGKVLLLLMILESTTKV